MRSNSQTRAMDFERNTVFQAMPCLEAVATFSSFPHSRKTKYPKQQQQEETKKEKYYLQTLEVMG